MKRNCKTILKVQNSEETKIFIIYNSNGVAAMNPFTYLRCH